MLTLNAVTIANEDDGNCDIFESGYVLKQKGYGGIGCFDSTSCYDNTIVSENGNLNPFTDNLDGTLTLQFATHIQDPETDDYTTEGAGAAMPLKTYDSDTGVICDLEDVQTKSCVQVFEVYAHSYSGELG